MLIYGHSSTSADIVANLVEAGEDIVHTFCSSSSASYFFQVNYIICTSNSMGSSEIWDKYHDCCIGNGDKFHEAKPSEIYHFQYNKSGIYPKFHCYPCYSKLIPYSLHTLLNYCTLGSLTIHVY